MENKIIDVDGIIIKKNIIIENLDKVIINLEINENTKN